ncbi:MAG: hypothetical protein ABIP38_00275 [Steroidobacteraceae bacterium]
MITPLRLLCVLVLIAVPTQAAAPHSVLDRGTGATIQTSAKPWIFALDQPQLAANARDYIALYAVEINIGGNRRHYLAGFFWSTVPGRQQFAGASPAISLQVDDRTEQLSAGNLRPRDVGISRWPLPLPGRGAVLAVYEVDQAMLRQLGLATNLRVRPETDATLPADIWFTSWREARSTFQAFAEQVLQP